MKKVISASEYKAISPEYKAMERKARAILEASKNLLDIMEEAPDELLRYNDLMPLHDELIDTVHYLSTVLSGHNLEY